jgi:UDP-N-acetylmuramate--alanine ligase
VTRAPAEVGAGLAAPRPARPISASEAIHVVGVAGAGASAAAIHAAAAGAAVSGCDPGGPSPYSPALEALGIPIDWAHDPGHVLAPGGGRAPSRLAVTKALTAVDPDHAELAAARSAGIPLEPWQQVIADAASGRTLVGVAGTHGKSTTAGWLVHVLASAGADPGAFVGALLPTMPTAGLPATARIGSGSTFVVEADEYAGNFDPYRPLVAVLTSVEWDHPDVFPDRVAVEGAFEAWLRAALEAPGRAPDDAGLAPTLVANVSDVGVAAVVGRLADTEWRIVATGLVDQAPQRLAGYARGIAERYGTRAGPARPMLGRIGAADPDGTTVVVSGLDDLSGPRQVRLATAGRHNASNALGVAGAATVLGLPLDAIVAGLKAFPGVGRRLERKGEALGVAVYDDYGHHPSAIVATIAAVRQREPDRRVWAVYEPLTYHRTAALVDGFAEALGTADAVAIADIWAGRDVDTSVTSPAELAAAVARHHPGVPVAAPGSVEATAAWLARSVVPGDVVLVMGGGRSYRIAELLLEALETR